MDDASNQTKTNVTTVPRIYLDNAATSWPKPPEVLAAITDFYQDIGTAAYRGNVDSKSDRAIELIRKNLAEFINANSEKEIVFAFNCTDALNMALHGTLLPGDHVVTSSLEHNSVFRPLNFLATHKGISFSVVEANENGVVDPDTIEAAIQADTKLVCLSHVSNVTGVVQPVNDVGDICNRKQLLYLVDAAQSLGHIGVDVSAMNCDFLAAPGHKGLFGPLGTGILYVNETCQDRILPYRQGGTGSTSDNENQPTQMPFKLESGNMNVGGILGLGAGLEYVQQISIDSIMALDRDFGSTLASGIAKNENVEVYFGGAPERTSVLSFNLRGKDPREVAVILETHFGIQVRAGLHCAPRSHKTLATFDRGGTVRISPGVFNTIDEINLIVDAIKQIADT